MFKNNKYKTNLFTVCVCICFSLRANYGTDVKSNGLHGSSNQEHAVAEMKILFGDVEFNEDGTVKSNF